ncbi:hypothetical protein KAR91_67045 [Candidatus Pacearchaeota archaeon]|nr:hypothetical protein [Candidatus Pacearchaeota archaeon]
MARIDNSPVPTIEFSVQAYVYQKHGKYFPAVRIMCNGQFHSNAYYGDGFDTEKGIAVIANTIAAEEVRKIKETINVVSESMDYHVDGDDE